MTRHVATFLVVAGLLVTGSRAWGEDWQRWADAQPWQWSEDHASLLYCVTRYAGGWRTEISCPKGGRTDRPLRVCFLDEGDKEVYSLQAHRGTVFYWLERVLFVAEFDPSDTGCSVTAYDVTQGKQLWKTRLRSCCQRHSAGYVNSVIMDDPGWGVLVIRGKEEGIHYLELLDMRTGETVAHRYYPLDR